MSKTDPELIVLLDQEGIPIGTAPKLSSHHENTPLHLAFSVYIFNQVGDFLVTRRADNKKVWNGVWTNSCCGHPMPSESMEDAITRRVEYEIGMTIINLKLVVPDYRYKTPPYNGIIENELCPIYVAQSNDLPLPHVEEVAEFEWLSWDSYCSRISNDTTNTWSWWCKDQLSHIIDTPEIKNYSTPDFLNASSSRQ